MLAAVTPRASVGLDRGMVLFYTPVLYPSIAELAKPFVDCRSGPYSNPR